jgi:CHASE3 domain sensor protein
LRFLGQRRIVLGFTIGILFILFSALGTFVITSQYQQTVNQLGRYSVLQLNITDLSVELDDAQTGQRGFLLTGNITYLAPYHSALDSINGTDSTLVLEIAGNSNLTGLFSQLQPIISEKLVELNETIVLRESQGFAAAEAVVNTNAGEVYMNEIGQILGKMIAYVSQLQEKERSLAATQSTERTTTTAFNTFVAVGAFSFAIYAASTNLRQEQKARREAELLQDILSHDIRNYNQVSRIGVEVLSDKYGNDPEARAILTSILESIDGSTELVDKGKMLGKVLSDDKVTLKPVDLLKSLDSSMALVKNATRNSGKFIDDKRVILSENKQNILVMADALLDNVFINLYSNSVKYTSSDEVYVLTTIDSTIDGKM